MSRGNGEGGGEKEGSRRIEDVAVVVVGVFLTWAARQPTNTVHAGMVRPPNKDPTSHFTFPAGRSTRGARGADVPGLAMQRMATAHPAVKSRCGRLFWIRVDSRTMCSLQPPFLHLRPGGML